MSHLLLGFKKSLICLMALATSASMLAPVSAYAVEPTPEVGVDNHTEGRENAKTVSGITIGDVTAPEEGKRLDDTAAVTTAEGETWEIPVIWIGEDLKSKTGIAGEGSYLPVLAYVVPDEYTIRSTDANGRGYKVTLSEDLLKLFGEDKIISIYENKTGITYILPAKLKDLYAQKGTIRNPTDEGGNEHVPADQAAPNRDDADDESAQEQEEVPDEEEEQSKDPEKEQEEEAEEEYSHIVNVHCDNNAKKALSESDLEFLADLLVNTLQPQAVNLLIDKFPALQKAVEKQEIGKYLTVIVTYDEGADYVGIANRGWVEDDNTYPDNNFVYSLTVNASSLADHKEGDIAVITRDTDSKELTDLANTVVHELFHCFSDDYNRPGLTGRLHDGDTLLDYSENVRFPTWFVEGTASTVENSWQFRQGLLKLLRTPFRSDDPLDNYTKDVLLERYVDGKYTLDENGNYKCDCNFDIEYSRGKDRYGLECDDTPSVYVSGYLACMYLYELAAAGDASIGSSRSTVGENTVIDSGKLRLGMNSIMERMHNGETLDQVINRISGGVYKDTADYEARFIKGYKNEDNKYGDYVDTASLDFIYDFMSYMNEIDKAKERGERNFYANGSVLFDFDKDFASPLSFDGTYTTDVLKPLDDEDGEFVRYARSTVSDRYASSTGGKSESGRPVSALGSSGDGILTYSAPSQENSSMNSSMNASMQEAAKETTAVDVGGTGAVEVVLDAESHEDEDAESEAPCEVTACEEDFGDASEEISEDTQAAAPEDDTEPAPNGEAEQE